MKDFIAKELVPVFAFAALVVAAFWAINLTPSTSAQTTGGRFTEEEITAIGAAQAQATVDAIPEPGNALLWQNQPAGVQIVLPADDNIVVPWKTADGAINHLLGTVINPPLDDGDYVSITRAGRYQLLVNVTVRANPQVEFSVYATKDTKKIQGVKSTADGTIATNHTVTILAFADLLLSERVRVGFSSATGGTLTVYDISLQVSWIGPEIAP